MLKQSWRHACRRDTHAPFVGRRQGPWWSNQRHTTPRRTVAGPFLPYRRREDLSAALICETVTESFASACTQGWMHGRHWWGDTLLVMFQELNLRSSTGMAIGNDQEEIQYRIGPPACMVSWTHQRLINGRLMEGFAAAAAFVSLNSRPGVCAPARSTRQVKAYSDRNCPLAVRLRVYYHYQYSTFW